MTSITAVLLTTLAACTGQFAAGAGGPTTMPAGTTSGGDGQTATAYTPPDTSAPAPTPTGEQAGFGSTLAEQKAVVEVETELQAAQDLVRAKCGVPAFRASVAWTDYLSLRDADFEGRARDNVYGCAKAQIGDSLRQLASSCADSALVRGSVQNKLASVVGHPRVGTVNAAHPSHVFTLQGGVMHIQYHFCTSNIETTELQKAL
jgi:hypothetical protein